MALSRRSGSRFEANIWPGFVDAMTALLLVLVFVLSIFMIVQFVLRETITSQDTELDQLTGRVETLADALGLEELRSAKLEGALSEADAQQQRQAALIASLRSDKQSQASQIAEFEDQVTALMLERRGLRGQISGLEGQLDETAQANAQLSARVEDLEAGLVKEISAKEAAELALARARVEIDKEAQEARLAAARSEALEALSAELKKQIASQDEKISSADAARLADAAAAKALRDKLENADAELTAMTLSLEKQRQEAEETLTLLAAANAAKDEFDQKLADALAAQKNAEGEALTQAEQREILLAEAKARLADEKEVSTRSQRQIEALNQQVAALRAQLGALQGLLDEAKSRDEKGKIEIENLGSQLNAALAQVASVQRERAKLEEAERKRLEEEASELKQYRSEFFGQLRQLLGNRDGVRIEGDRFVFSSEVLFRPARAELSPEGREEVAKVAQILGAIADDIPESLNWVIRVDGHTDNTPLSRRARYRDNWELSQARALSVVRYLSEELGIAPDRLAANGFGQYQPINPADTPEARAQNRRIELKLTEK